MFNVASILDEESSVNSFVQKARRGRRCGVLGSDGSDPTRNTPSCSQPAFGLIDEPLEEWFGAGGDLVEGIAQQAAVGKGKAAGVGGAGLGRQLSAAVQ